MAGRLSYSIALNLITDSFKKGANAAKNSLKSLQYQILSFGAALGFGGVGLSNLVSKMIEVARETGRVNVALKNVSGSMAQFVNNQGFMLELANKYGVEINTLTGSFVKFTASANAAGMSMADQKKVYESVTRAIVGFGLKQQEASDVYYALSQMMSKSKISSEELRRQMGERFPIAIQAMAKAVGVTVGELDALLKKGEVISKDVLPKFADALNEMVTEVNTDNLETSLNRLQNIFVDAIKKAKIFEAYKKIIDSISAIVKSATEDIGGVINRFASAIIIILSIKLFGWLKKQWIAARVLATRTLIQAAKEAGTTFDTTVKGAVTKMNILQAAAIRTGVAIKTLFVSAIPLLILTAIAAVVNTILDFNRGIREAKQLVGDFEAEAKKVGMTAEVERLKVLQKIVNDTNNSMNERKSALNEINSLLGTSLTFEGNINDVIQKRIKLIESAANAEFYANKKVEAEARQKDILSKYGGLEANLNAYKTQYDNMPALLKLVSPKLKGAAIDYEEYQSQKRIATTSSAELERAVKGGYSVAPPPTVDPTSGGGEVNKVDEVLKKYKESLEGYERQLSQTLITEKEFNEAKRELLQKTLLDAAAAGKFTDAQQKTIDSLKAMEASMRVVDTTQLQKTIKEHETEMSSLTDQYNIGIINEQEYKDEQLRLIESTRRKIASGEQLNDAERNYIALLGQQADSLRTKPKMEQYDSTFDYKKSKSEILDDTLSVAKKNLDALKDAYNSGSRELIDELNAAMENVSSMEEALKIARVKEDVKSLGKEMNNLLYGGVKDIASSADQMVNAFDRLVSVFSDVDSSGWEKIMAIWGALTGTIDQVMTILEFISRFTELTNQLATAKQAEAAVDTATTQTKIANKVAETGISIASDTAMIASKSGVIAANTADAASSAAAGAAKLPFPLSLIAVGAAIAGVIALMASIPKFAGGGVFKGGSGVGDKFLARVNPGEMILNAGQQSTLFNMIKNGTGGTAGDVRFVIEGEKLVGVMNKYGKRVKRGS